MARQIKDSGVDWLGEIPADWNVIRLKYIARFVQTKYTAADGDLNYIGLENVVGWDGMLTETDSVYDRDQSLICTAGDILFGKLRPYLGKVYLNTVKQCCSAEFAVIRMNSSLCRLFFRYQLMSHGFIFMVDSSTYGAKMPRANVNFIKNMRAVVPPLDEQQRIADFLDEKCARIDSVVAKTRASIDEYRKLKQSVITRAVTKGIRPNRPMKDSGIDWIGEIPVDFDCCKLKHLISSLNSGISVTATELMEEGYPVYGGGSRIGFIPHYNMEDTLVIGRVGARCGCITKIIGKAWATDNALIVKTDFPIDYLYYILTAEELNKLSTSNAQPLITSGKVLNLKVPIPPLDEQKEIVDYLDEKTAAIDSLITKKNQLVSELESLKKSLIFEYVTGKKEVPT